MKLKPRQQIIKNSFNSNVSNIMKYIRQKNKVIKTSIVKN